MGSSPSALAVSESTEVPNINLEEMPGTTPKGSLELKIEVANRSFQMREFLGSGVYGRVFKAVDLSSGDFVAVKFILPRNNRDTRPRRAELAVFAALRENCKLKLHKTFPCLIGGQSFSDGGAVLVMELATGESLSAAFQAGRSNMTNQLFISLCVKCVEPVVAMHEALVTHGDIKGENMVVEFDDKGLVKNIKILDFGLSCASSSMASEDKDTCHARFSKKPSYMDPKYTTGVRNLFHADVFSLGVLLGRLARSQSAMLTDMYRQFVLNLSQEMCAEGPRPSALQALSSLERFGAEPGLRLTVNGRTLTLERPLGISFHSSVWQAKQQGSARQRVALKMSGLFPRAAREALEREVFVLAGIPGALIDLEFKERRGEACAVLREVKGKPWAPGPGHAALLARALEKLQGRGIALLEIRPTDFYLQEDVKLVLVNFRHAVSVKMMRDRQDLTSEVSEANIFALAVMKLGTFLSAQWPQLSSDPVVLATQKPNPNSRPTMGAVATHLSSSSS